MVFRWNLLLLSSLIFSIVAMVLSLARILRSHKEGKRKRQSDLFSNVTRNDNLIFELFVS